LLVVGIEHGRIDSETADEWLETWRDERGYYAPVESVSEPTELIDGDAPVSCSIRRRKQGGEPKA